jgi:hypothetical protein
VTIGRNTLRLAAATNVKDDTRAAIRAALAPLVEQLCCDLALTADAIGGPDPEYALSLFVDVLHELPASLHTLDLALAAERHLRVAA